MNIKAYVLFLCLFVFTAFTALFTTMIVFMVRQHIKMVRGGLEDDQLTEKTEENSKNTNTKKELVCKILSCVLCGLITLIFIFSAYSSLFGNGRVNVIPAVKVVSSPSMSNKYENNDYLFENKLDNQIKTFDLVVLHKLPAEEDIQLYDIVVYEMEGYMVIHRIVGIEEPNEAHPDERYFLLQGDAAEYPDTFPVRYSQMRSIYRDQRIPFIGSFIYFMQSPAGILCYILILFAFIALPIVEKKIAHEHKLRLEEIREKEESNEEN